MKALAWMGRKNVEVQRVADPQILRARDCIGRITPTAICGSGIHLYKGSGRKWGGDIIGHEFMEQP